MIEDVDMTPSGQKYVDHPAPSVLFQMILGAVMLAILTSMPAAVREASGVPTSFVPLALGVVLLTLLSFYFWPLYSTYYTLSASGLVVTYGPWTRQYSYSDFATAYWRKGMFGRGWPSVTPCVRLTNAVVLKRRSSWFDLYLTPNDPKDFLNRLSLFAPELTKEAII